MQNSYKGITRRQKLKAPILAGALLLVIMTLGSFGFMIIEEYRFIDALYMTIITMATVGFSEVEPLSDQGKFFAILLILSSIGIFAYTASTISRYLLDGIFSNQFKTSRLKKMIGNLENHVIVVGYGRNGSEAAIELRELGEITVIIDRDENVVQKINDDGFIAIQGDATTDESLLSANIKNAKALIAALPNDADNLFVVLSAKEYNTEIKIISRALQATSDKKLKAAGATNVIMPDRLGGKHMANLVAQPDIIEFLDNILLKRTDNIRLEEVSCKRLNDCFSDKSIGEVGIRNKSGANIIGMKLADGSYKFNPEPSTIINKHDQLFVLGSTEQLKMLKGLLENG